MTHAEIEEKYADVIKCIAKAEDVDLGVALDMLVANVMRGGDYKYVNEDEFEKDWEEHLKD